MKAWFDKYFSLTFALYLFGCSLWFVYVRNTDAWAGYMCASMGWFLVCLLERLHKQTVDELAQRYADSIERSIGGKDGK